MQCTNPATIWIYVTVVPLVAIMNHTAVTGLNSFFSPEEKFQNGDQEL